MWGGGCTEKKIYNPKIYLGNDTFMIFLYIYYYILTYRNNPSYTLIGILIFLSVRSNTDQIRIKLRLFQAHLMCSRNRVLTYSWTS